MINYNDVKILHLEPSQLCNASCAICNRRHLGGEINTNFNNDVVTLSKAKKWFPPEFISNLGSLILCGNLGDPMTAPELIDILKYFKEHNPNLFVTMHTNGGGRSEEFWEELSQVMWPNGRVVFSVDGLQDTNHIYRKDVKWDLVMRSMKAYINKGGIADWEYLVFRHNKHQVEEARAEAERMGVNKFIAKDAYGFETDEGTKSQYIPVLKDNSTLDYYIYSKDTPDDFEAQTITDIKSANEIFDHTLSSNINEIGIDYKKELEERSIDCYTKTNKEIYVSADGNVFPCCYFAGRYYGNNSYPNAQLREFFDFYSEDSINLNKTPLQSIVESDVWHKYIPATWQSNDLNKKLMVCSIFCGKCK